MQVKLGEKKEWISLLSANAPNTHRVISEDGEEFEFVSNDSEPLEAQISRLLAERGASAASQ
jgi:hypothetical protein